MSRMLARTIMARLAHHDVASRSMGPAVAAFYQQKRYIGAWFPEFWGQKSRYTEGTGFLGTPTNHIELAKKRPISPDVLDIKGLQPHYRFPVTAISSIVNRGTGVAMSVGAFGMAYLSLTGDIGAVIDTLRLSHPAITFTMKTVIAFPVVYHMVAGLRHLVWDYGPIPIQAEKKGPLEVETAANHSRIILAASVALSGMVGLYYW